MEFVRCQKADLCRQECGAKKYHSPDSCEPCPFDKQVTCKPKKRHIFLIDDGENNWYSAESEAVAIEMHAIEFMGYKAVKEYIEDMEEPDIQQLDDNQELTVRYDDNVEKNITHTCRDWADKERGCIASTIF